MNSPSTPSFSPGDRVTPRDPKSLWSNTHCTVIVMSCYPCVAVGAICDETIEVEVKWTGSPSFLTIQPADRYELASSRHPIR